MQTNDATLSYPQTQLLTKGEPGGGGRGFLVDPRIYQIVTLAGLLIYGMVRLDFEIGLAQAATTIGCALAAQWICGRFFAGAFDPRSALISGLSLCLLLRTNSLGLAAIAAIGAVVSKFMLRWRGKHLFNPTNFGIVALMLATDGRVWVSPGQWGNVAFFGFLMACLGGVVVNRAARADVTMAWLASYLGLVFGRSLWLGEPMTIPFHRLQSGGLLLFSFFMISDPKTTPDSRAGRILFAALVAYGAWYVQFRLFRTNGVLWSLAGGALLVPLIDWLLPGTRYQWGQRRMDPPPRRRSEMPPDFFPSPAGLPALRCFMKTTIALIAAFAIFHAEANAFCGFYVAKADAKLFNKASQVVLVRDGDRTVLTMASDYEGELDEFAVVVPVPTALERGQIHVADKALIEHLDAYSAPRLVEYYDPDPCMAMMALDSAASPAPMMKAASRGMKDDANALGVTIEAQYTVGEYDIVILSAAESNGLETWLVKSGYKIPEGASDVLGSYIKQKMHFFVAKVNLAEQSKLGFTYLRPLQVAYNSPKFVLPLRLGMVNAKGSQDLVIYALTKKGRVETTNYRTVKMPTGMEIPIYVKEKFGDFYKAMFDQQAAKEDLRCVFTEYAWDMGWCDPCAADPLTAEELRKLGVFWETVRDGGSRWQGGGSEVYVTRLHVRYDRAHFPEDLVFQETGDRTNFQGRYVLRHPWEGKATCDAAKAYAAGLPKRHEQEAETLASLTGWDLAKIRDDMHLDAPAETGGGAKWWEKIFK